jgi:hypothetical protein
MNDRQRIIFTIICAVAIVLIVAYKHPDTGKEKVKEWKQEIGITDETVRERMREVYRE